MFVLWLLIVICSIGGELVLVIWIVMLVFVGLNLSVFDSRLCSVRCMRFMFISVVCVGVLWMMWMWCCFEVGMLVIVMVINVLMLMFLLWMGLGCVSSEVIVSVLLMCSIILCKICCVLMICFDVNVVFLVVKEDLVFCKVVDVLFRGWWILCVRILSIWVCFCRSVWSLMVLCLIWLCSLFFWCRVVCVCFSFVMLVIWIRKFCILLLIELGMYLVRLWCCVLFGLGMMCLKICCFFVRVLSM